MSHFPAVCKVVCKVKQKHASNQYSQLYSRLNRQLFWREYNALAYQHLDVTVHLS